MHKSDRCRVDFFFLSFRNSNGGYKTQFRHMSLAPVRIWFIMFLVFFPELALGKKNGKGAPLQQRVAYRYNSVLASHDISPGGNADTSPRRICRHRGLNASPPCARNTKGEKTVKTSSSCVFGRKRRNGHVKDPRNAPRTRCPPPAASGPDPLCDTTSDTIVFVLLLLLLFNRNNGPDVWGRNGEGGETERKKL